MFELFALKYGTSQYPEKYIFGDKKESLKSIPFAWLFYLIKINGKNILFDTGFSDPFVASKFGIELINPVELISQLDINSDEIDIVLLSHAHSS